MDSPINDSALTSALRNLQRYRSIASIRNLIVVCSEKTQAHFANEFAEVCRDIIAVLNDKLAGLEGFHETLACMSAHDVETIVNDVEWAFSQMHWSQLIDSWSVANMHSDLRCDEWFSTHDKPDLQQYRSDYQMCHDKVGQVMMLHYPMLIDANPSCDKIRINAATVAARLDNDLLVQTQTGDGVTEYLLHILRGAVDAVHPVINLICYTHTDVSGQIFRISPLHCKEDKWINVTNEFVALMSHHKATPLNSV